MESKGTPHKIKIEIEIPYNGFDLGNLPERLEDDIKDTIADFFDCHLDSFDVSIHAEVGRATDKICYKCDAPALYTYGGKSVCKYHLDKLEDEFDEEYR